ncbi:MAG TPA: M48 family metallopeptidase, partial [Pyrinomonadaceae bacterium]|nr:M48 family metallopeptidase [Pyrinomonadaceae bacterium]
MFNQLSRTIAALALAWLLVAGGSTAALAAPQKQASKSEKEAAEQKAKAAAEKQDREDAAELANVRKKAEASKGKPLSTDEDPGQIGKRKINGGLIASMSGSIEKEVSFGRELAAEVDRQAKFIEDPVITEYVNRVGQNVVLHSDAKIPFTIKVIDSDEVNAFALPGGFFYVNKGLLLAADNEAEIAGVMAHEIAHVAARHAMENIAKANLYQGLAMAGSIFLGGIPGLIYQNTAGLGLAALFSKFSRSAESEADRLGTQYLYAAGYDPGAMATMFEKLASKNKKKPGFFAKTFASHPQSIERLEASRVLVGRFPERDEYVLSTSEFQRVKGRLLRLSNAK